MCEKHYRRLMRTGTTDCNFIEDPIERFHSYYTINENTGCWVWDKCSSESEYGRFHAYGKCFPAHRFSYELHVGKIPKGLVACHKCDNPPCVNPNHIFIGTHLDNTIDMHRKGRGRYGENHGRAKLTINDVNEIRKDYNTGGITQRKLAEKYGVSKSTIGAITTRTNWRMFQ